jgi:tripartite-type tricarboxylate transporter receptor subunit TctC
MTRGSAISIVVAGVIAVVCAAAHAQNKYPQQTVTMVTHSSPGGGSDVFVRELVRHLGPVMGVTFVVENRPGGSGAKAIAKIAQSPADGSAFYVTTPTYIQTTLLSKLDFGYDSLDPLVTIFRDPEIVYTRKQSPFNTLADAVTYAKQSGKGKWGAANPTSLERIALEKLNRVTGARAAVVPHEGGGDMMLNVLNGSLDLGIGEVQEILPQLQSGRVKLLGVFEEKRLEQYPDVPTAREQGFDVVVTKFRGLAAPKGLPPAVVQAWEQAIPKVLARPEYQKIYGSENLIPAYRNQKESRELTAEVAKDVATSLRELGIIK